MPSQTMEILRNNMGPQAILEAVIEKIADAERCYPVTQEVRDHFNKAFKSWGRNWGECLGEIEDIKVQTGFLDPGFHVTFAYEEYSRGCYMSTSNYRIFVPDNLVQLYERSVSEDDPDVDASLENAIEILIKERITSIKTDISEAAQKKLAEEEANNRTYEDSERAEYHRLQAKYGSD